MKGTVPFGLNLDGSLKTQTYPSGRVLQHTYDGSARPYAVQEAGGGPSYLNSVVYRPHGGIDSFQLGNLLTEQTCYNDLLQPIARRLGGLPTTNCAVQGSDLLHLGFSYGAAAQNNGNMTQQTIWAPDNGSGSPWSVTQDYTYDAVNRLATSAEKLSSVTQWSRSYAYDHFGNRWISGATGHTLHMATPTSQAAIQATTNRLTGTGIAYDNAGNLTAHPFITPGSGSMAYDANNKMTAFVATGVSVATKYDAVGRRVRKVYNGQTTIWVYNAFGALAAEYSTETNNVDAIYYRTTDHLGSTRVTTDEVGDVVARRDFFPFGEQIDSTLSSRGAVRDGTLASFNAIPGMRQQFTGQQRDQETGLDYFWARNYHPATGRFMAIDPQNAGMRYHAPQSWNAFVYADNSPMRYFDPNGLNPFDSTGCTWDPGSATIDCQTADPTSLYYLFQTHAQMIASDMNPLAISISDFHSLYDSPYLLAEHIRNNPDAWEMLYNLAGFIPVIDVYVDGSYTIYLVSKEQYFDAGISFAAAWVPGISASYAQKIFRRNLIELTGKVAGDAHHVFPKAFQEKFNELGINIWDTRNAAWWDSAEHRALAHEYNLRWETWFQANPNATATEATQFAQDLATEYGFELNF